MFHSVDQIDNHKESGDWFLSISDINQLISIDVYRCLSILIEYRNYRCVTPCPLPLGFSNFNQNYDRSNFSQFLLPLANLDISHTLLCFVSKIGFPMFWIRTQLEFSGFIPNWNQPRIMNQCFFRGRFEERNSRLKSGQQNAKSPTEDSQRGVKFVLFRGNPP